MSLIMHYPSVPNVLYNATAQWVEKNWCHDRSRLRSAHFEIIGDSLVFKGIVEKVVSCEMPIFRGREVPQFEDTVKPSDECKVYFWRQESIPKSLSSRQDLLASKSDPREKFCV